jgi:dihydropteroate synthase-like protein
MKVLLVTGRMAQDLVQQSANGADVLVLPVDVAAFITPQMLVEAAPQGYDLVLIPGAITANFVRAEQEINSQIRLGPKHAADLGFVLKNLERVELSSTIPACVLLEDKITSLARADLVRLEEEASFAFEIRGVKIGGTSRVKVLAEIVDSNRLGKEELERRIEHFRQQGADMIDLGFSPDASLEEAEASLLAARAKTDLPLSIDTVRADLIRSGLKWGADLVLSLSAYNLAEVGEEVAAAGVPAVVIPGPGSVSLEENVMAAKSLGIRVIADPVLDPPLQGLVSSLERYTSFQRAFPEVPMFFGAGNVTELLDADSVGANALLAAMAAEAGASVLFTPEYSPKARGSIRELFRASEMMSLASWRRTPPKDLGVDLLLLKDKKRLLREDTPAAAEEARFDHLWQMDPAGSFSITLSDERILVRHQKVCVSGTSARDIMNTLIDLQLVSRLDHAGYLGRELQKAELALQLEKNYVQDEPLTFLKKAK